MNSGLLAGISEGRPIELYLPEVIYEETLQANGAFDIQGIPLIYDKFELECRLRGTVSATSEVLYLFFNNDTTVANYRTALDYSRDGSTGIGATRETPEIAAIPTANSQAGVFGAIHIEVLCPQDNKIKDSYINTASRWTVTDSLVESAAHNWESTAPITRIQLRTDNHPTDLFVAGSSVRLLGWRKFRIAP